jgi:hypothetical protein
LYLIVRWVFSLTSVMIDGTRNWLALDFSARAVRGMWWRTLGILIVVGLIQVGPILIGSVSTLAAPIVEGVVTSGVSALVLPFGIAAQTLLYYDLKARHADDFRPTVIEDPQSDVSRETT